MGTDGQVAFLDPNNPLDRWLGPRAARTIATGAYQLAWSPDRRTIAIRNFSNVSVWNVVARARTFQLLKHPRLSLDDDRIPRTFAFSPDGKLVTSDGDLLRFTDPVTENSTTKAFNESLTKAFFAQRFSFSSGTSSLVVAGTAVVVSGDFIASTKPLVVHAPPRPDVIIDKIDASLGIGWLGSNVLVATENGHVEEWDPESKQRVRDVALGTGSTRNTTFAVSSRGVVALMEEKRLAFWSPATNETRVLEMPTPGSFAFSPSGDEVVIATGERPLFLRLEPDGMPTPSLR
jgi:hypothetical protein